MCRILKNFSDKLKPFHEVVRIINKTLGSKKRKDIKHLFLYAEGQFDKEAPHKGFRVRVNGDRISNFEADVIFLLNINTKLVASFRQDNSPSKFDRDNARFPYLERLRSLLKPWLIHLELNACNRSDSLDEDQMNTLLHELIIFEQNMAVVTMDRNQLDRAEGHCR
jgi:hypothetical protein